MGKQKDNFLLSIPDSISLLEALDGLDSIADVFVAASEKDQNKPIGNLANYICFHKDLQIGVYRNNDRYFAAQIKPAYKKWGVYMPTSFLELSEILTDATDDFHLETASFAGATLFGATTSKEEKAFLEALTTYDAWNISERASELAAELRNKVTEDSSSPESSQEKPDDKKKSDDLFDNI